jgi:hypothetical protein
VTVKTLALMVAPDTVATTEVSFVALHVIERLEALLVPSAKLG